MSGPTVPVLTQGGFQLRFDWGPSGLRALAPAVDVVVIVDVLRFTTCVDVAVARGAAVLPYPWRNGTEADFARDHGAELAGTREDPATPWSLSPTDVATIGAGTRLVLPSPNGSALAFAARDQGAAVLAGCLRNASAVADAAAASGRVIGVVAAGERWRGATGPLRPSVEDLLGAGAVLAALATPARTPAEAASPEARAAIAAFEAARRDLAHHVEACASGRELLERGWGDDVAASASHDVSDAAPVLRRGVDGAWAFVAA